MAFRQLIMDYLSESLGDTAALRQDYPSESPASPVVTYTEAANNAYRTLDGVEYLTEYEALLDVFAPDVKTADEIANILSGAMRDMGFRRTFSNDASPLDGGRHTQMRFRGLIGPGNIVYQS